MVDWQAGSYGGDLEVDTREESWKLANHFQHSKVDTVSTLVRWCTSRTHLHARLGEIACRHTAKVAVGVNSG